MKAVILAAGKGTRLGKSSEMIPKPLQKIGEKAVIEHQLELLASFGITEIIILIHHLGDKIRAFLEDGKKYGVTISYIEVPLNLGTAGSVSLIQDQLVDDFLVLYADVMMKLDVLELITFHQSHPKSYGTLVVHPNSHPFDSDLLSLDDNDQITAVFPKPHRVNQYYPNVVNAALYILSPQIFSSIIPDKELDFGKDIFATLIQNKKPLFGYRTTEYLKDMGTPERLAEVRSDYESKTKMRFTKKRPAVFLDRDGVVIKQVDQLHELEKVKLLPHAGKAIHLLNKVGYLVVIITNQPMIAKGYLTYDD